MTYNEWIEALKQHLLLVSDEERAKVLDYYSEVYADRRENGESERDIIADFGEPYQAAHRILFDGRDAPAHAEGSASESVREEAPRPANGEACGSANGEIEAGEMSAENGSEMPLVAGYVGGNAPAVDAPKGHRLPRFWSKFFRILINVATVVIKVVAIFVIAASLTALVCNGVAYTVAGVGVLITETTGEACTLLGLGLTSFGVSAILAPLAIKLEKFIVSALLKLKNLIYRKTR